MDLIDYLITQISPLSWTVKGAGFIITAVLVMRAFGQFFSFRWIKAITSLVTAVVVLLALARFGPDLDTYLENQKSEPTQASQSS